MSSINTDEKTIKPTDLRGILKYVPMFREHIFVIAVDGSLVAHENFQNVLLDIAVLRSLNIKVVFVYGIGQQLQALAETRKIAITDTSGEGITDQSTLDLASEASAAVSQIIMEGLAHNGLRCAITNAVRSKKIGILKGVDQLHSGTVDKLDTQLLAHLLDIGTIPVIAPIAFTREGPALRINSDLLAAELASQLNASKLVYLTTHNSLQLDEKPITNLPVAKLDALLQEAQVDFPKHLKSKAFYAVKAINAGVPRTHILDGRLFGALLNEIFDKVGIGTMIYSNDYQSIRRAVDADAHSIYTITQNGVRSETLVDRSLAMIKEAIDNYLVYEIDGSIVGCVYLKDYPEDSLTEIGSVYVLPFYQNKGVGRRMIEYAQTDAKKRATRRLLALTTQAATFFTELCGFTEGSLDDLPAARKSDYVANGRNSKILVKDL